MTNKILSLEETRVDYSIKEILDLNLFSNNPFLIFKYFYNEAYEASISDVNAMTLSTIDKNNFPQSRQVLLKELNETGFIFYTNYQSKKALEIDKCNKVSLNFFWRNTEKQIRITGTASKVSREKSFEYFSTRPRGSQLASLVSRQSKEIKDKSELISRYDNAKDDLKGKSIDCPAFWGGYIVEPLNFEFWQGGKNRLHDRVYFEKTQEGWCSKILEP
jgi:pyridoxamine 5'-phosphate oxidase